MTRRLVITADDFGRDPGTTATIAGLLRDGAVTATTLITVAPGASEALDLARDLGVVPHLHLTLTSEGGLPGWAPLGGGPSLTDPAGLLWRDPVALAARAATAEVLAELDAQRGWLLDRGTVAVAADSHAGTLYGLHGRSWLAKTLQWCAQHGLAFRLPRDPAPYLGGPVPSDLATAHAAAVDLADTLGVALPATILTNRRAAADLTDHTALLTDLVAQVAELPEGTSELFLHPSAPGAVPGPAGTVRAWEAQLLRDPAWQAALQREGIELVDRWWP